MFCTFLAVMLVVNSISMMYYQNEARKNKLMYLNERLRNLTGGKE
jgi:hypothetical protein